MPVLATKLQPPRLRAERVSRPALLERLNAGLARPLTLISAPAGFGKTTLVAEWLADCPLPSAWVSLDEQDSDPSRYLAYLTAALRQIEDEAGQATRAAFAFAGPLASLPAVMPQLINEIASIPEEFLLVLDDYHLITATAIHEAMTFLVDHPPACMHLVLATRADPPLPLARLRARGQLNELRQADLRFTSGEAAALLEQAVVSGLTPRQIDTLTDRTEGWIAGLQMAALALRELPAEPGQSHPGADALIQAFSGTHRHVLDYLVEEVLNRLPAHIQSFLLQTSILERLCASLCDSVVSGPPGSSDDGTDGATPPVAFPSATVHGQQMLEDLERNNLFVTPLDDRRGWYRYHRLFADLLRQRLQATATPGGESGIAVLHQRAAAWYEAQGILPEAIRHAVSAGDYECAAGCVERAVPAAWRNGELETIQHWIEALPVTALSHHPLLCAYAAASALLRTASLDRAKSFAQMASDHDPDGRVSGEVAVVQALFALYRGDTSGGLEHAQSALPRLPEASPFGGLARRALSALYLMARDLSSAEKMLETDLRACETAGDRLGASASLRRLGSMALHKGELRRAHSFYQRALEMSRDSSGRLWPVAGRVLTHLGELALEWNDLKQAEGRFTEALDLVGQMMPGLNAAGYMALARLHQSAGDAEGARRDEETARVLARTTDTLMDDLYLDLEGARLALLRGDLAAAERWAARWSSQLASPAPTKAQDVETLLRSQMFGEMGRIMQARLHLAGNRPDQALAMLEEMLGESSDHRISGSQIELLGLRALARRALGQPEAALSDLKLALELAEPEGFVRTFIDEGQPMRRLLREAASRNVGGKYVGRLLDAMEADTQQAPASRSEPPSPVRRPAVLAEPLTEREVEVLRLLRTSLTTPEMAAALGIAPSTVRTFVKNLYGKLDVHRRIEAIERAEELGILQA